MQDNTIDTIVAQATARGLGGVGIVRVSGPLVCDIAKALLKEVPKPRYASYAAFLDYDQSILDTGIALYFQNPHSFTGEDVLELQGHGGPIVLDLLLKRICQLGARLANPGEFSLRAFLNNKIDLLQAEAVADLISSTTEQAARSAVRSLQGEFSRHIEQLIESLIHLRIYVESSIDFAEEEIEFLVEGQVEQKITHLLQEIEKILLYAKQGQLLLEGIKVVIMGRPNAGKSSLLNFLAGYEAAIVTDIPGTTRDVLKETIQLEGLLLHILDTAGLRDSTDVIEQEGIRRAWKAVESADQVILMVDATSSTDPNPFELFPSWMEKLPKNIGITVFCNKIDKVSLQAHIEIRERYSIVYASLKTQEGLDLFKAHLKQKVGFEESTPGIIARQRHIKALEDTKLHLLEAERFVKNQQGGEWVAEALRFAQISLEEMTGRFTSDDLLGKIFSQFCIGK